MSFCYKWTINRCLVKHEKKKKKHNERLVEISKLQLNKHVINKDTATAIQS